MSQARIQRLRESGEDAERVLKSASGTAKYTMHMRYVAHALGFGPDSLAACFMPLFWRSEWPEPMERAYTSLLQSQYESSSRLLHEERSVWSRIFADRVAAGLPDPETLPSQKERALAMVALSFSMVAT